MPQLIHPKTENTHLAIAAYAIGFLSILGLLVFGFYSLMQPKRLPNAGLLAYKPPLATVMNYPAGALSDATRAVAPPPAPVQPADEPPRNDPPAAVEALEQSGLAAMAAAPPVKKKRAAAERVRGKRAVRVTTRRTPPGPSRGLAAAYAGYAAVQ